MDNVMNLKHGKGNLQREYLLAEGKSRNELAARYVDESYEWKGGFD